MPFAALMTWVTRVPICSATFPRMLTRHSDDIARPVGGAIAGLLCKQDRTYGPWHSLDQQGMGLHRHLVPAVDIDDEDARLLNRAGLNVIATGPAGRCRVGGSVTMGRGSEVHRKFARLPVRRMCLQIISTIATAARWAVFEAGDKNLARRIRAQVLTYLYRLNDLGAFADDRFIVECDAGAGGREDRRRTALRSCSCFAPRTATNRSR